jgi:hypothetical protein
MPDNLVRKLAAARRVGHNPTGGGYFLSSELGWTAFLTVCFCSEKITVKKDWHCEASQPPRDSTPSSLSFASIFHFHQQTKLNPGNAAVRPGQMGLRQK